MLFRFFSLNDGLFKDLLIIKGWKKIATEVTLFTKFYKAEAYHQDFERRNPNQAYVKAVSIPRLNRFKRKFPALLKKEKQLMVE